MSAYIDKKNALAYNDTYKTTHPSYLEAVCDDAHFKVGLRRRDAVHACGVLVDRLRVGVVTQVMGKEREESTSKGAYYCLYPLRMSSTDILYIHTYT